MIILLLLLSSYPDEEAGEIPMAYIVRKPESTLTEAQVIDFIAKQAWSISQEALNEHSSALSQVF